MDSWDMCKKEKGDPCIAKDFLYTRCKKKLKGEWNQFISCVIYMR